MVFLPPQKINSVIFNEFQQLKFSQLSLHKKVQHLILKVPQPGNSNNKKYSYQDFGGINQ